MVNADQWEHALHYIMIVLMFTTLLHLGCLPQLAAGRRWLRDRGAGRLLPNKGTGFCAGLRSCWAAGVLLAVGHSGGSVRQGQRAQRIPVVARRAVRRGRQQEADGRVVVPQTDVLYHAPLLTCSTFWCSALCTLSTLKLSAVLPKHCTP